MRVDTRQAQVVLTADGQVGFDLEDGDEILVQKAEQKVKLVHFGDSSFYRAAASEIKELSGAETEGGSKDARRDTRLQFCPD